MIRSLQLCLLLLLALNNSFATPKNTNIAVVDVLQILERSLAVQSIKQGINEISDNIHNELSTKDIEFKRAENDLTKKKGSLPNDEFEKQVATFNQNVSKAQREVENKKRKLEHAHATAMNKVHQVTVDIIHKLAKSKKFDIALPTSQILYADNALDITKEVLEELNKTLPIVTVEYK